MSQFAFSHKFSQRWLNQPPQARAAIMQTLDDVVTLLDDKTNLDDFQFSHPDLQRYLAELDATPPISVDTVTPTETVTSTAQTTAEDASNTSSHSETTVTTTTSSTANKDRPEANKKRNSDNQTKVYTNSEIDKAALSRRNTPITSLTAHTAETVKANSDHTQNIEKSKPITQSDQLENGGIKSDAPLTDNKALNGDLDGLGKIINLEHFEHLQLNNLDKEAIKALERLIDDYLSEQMAAMSENIKAWLHEQLQDTPHSKDKN